MMKRGKSFIFLVVVAILLIASGCSSEQDCSDRDTKYTTYEWDDEAGECVVATSKQRDVCGNGIQEEGETYCNCEEDVAKDLPIEQGGCQGTKGEYLKYTCVDSSQQCELVITEKVEKKTKLLELREGNRIEIDAEVSYYEPFMTDRHQLSVELLLKQRLSTQNEEITDINIRKVYVVNNQGDFLGEVSPDNKLMEKFESYETNVPLNKFSFDTFDKTFRNINLRLVITYTRTLYNSDGDVQNQEELTTELQDIMAQEFTLINPNNKEEDLEDDSSGWS